MAESPTLGRVQRADSGGMVSVAVTAVWLLGCVPVVERGTPSPTASATPTPTSSSSPVARDSLAPTPGAATPTASTAATAALATPMPTATALSPTSTPTETAVTEIQADWIRATPGFTFLPSGLVANQQGYVAYGLAGVAFSSDGVTWADVSPDSGTIAGSAAASESAFAILGLSSPDDGVWISEGGMEWSFHVITSGDGAVRHIAASDSGFLAMGEMDFPGGRAGAWFSPDGATWTQVSAPDVEDVVAISAFGDGFVAVGSERDTLTFQRTTYSVWRTIDGTEWEVFGSFPDQVCCSPSDIVGHGESATIVGGGDCEGRLIGAAWNLGGDPLRWMRAEHTAALNETALFGVAADSSGLVAVGTQGEEFETRSVGIWTSTDGLEWHHRSILSGRGPWFTHGPALGGAGQMVVASQLSSWNPTSGSPAPDPLVENVTWLLPPGGSPGGDLSGTQPPHTSGCDDTRVGTSLRAVDLESDLTTYVPLSFETVEIEGRAARLGTNAAKTVEAVLIGDPADIERIEVRGRDTESEAGAAVFALGWLWANDDVLFNTMFEVQEGSRNNFEYVIADLAVTGNRLAGDPWEYEFIVVPAGEE